MILSDQSGAKRLPIRRKNAYRRITYLKHITATGSQRVVLRRTHSWLFLCTTVFLIGTECHASGPNGLHVDHELFAGYGYLLAHRESDMTGMAGDSDCLPPYC